MAKVITYVTGEPGSMRLNLSLSQIEKLEKAKVWPKDDYGREYCQVYKGEHSGFPTYSDAILAHRVGLE